MTDKQEQQVQTAIRVPESWLDRLDKIAERMSRPGVRITRTEALRDALYRGIEVIEADGKKR
jgi:predicted DNA-binding protein